MVATGPSLNKSLCQKIFLIYGGNRTIAKYIPVSTNIFLSMAATGPSLNISMCQNIFFIYGGYRTIAKYIAVSINIFIYGGNQTIAKYIAASKKIFNNMVLVTLTALDSKMALLAAFNHRESERTSVCPISDSLRPIS